jgi:hypothetical protein
MFKYKGATLARRLERPINPASTALFGAFTALWGIFVALPYWDVFGRAPIYGPLLQIAPEMFWGILALVCGLMMLWGALRNSFQSLQYGSFIGFMHWTVLTIAFYLGDWQNTAWLTYGFIAFLCSFMYLNIRMNKNNLHKEKN